MKPKLTSKDFITAPVAGLAVVFGAGAAGVALNRLVAIVTGWPASDMRWFFVLPFYVIVALVGGWGLAYLALRCMFSLTGQGSSEATLKVYRPMTLIALLPLLFVFIFPLYMAGIFMVIVLAVIYLFARRSAIKS